MVKKVNWTPEAIDTFNQIIDWLNQKWTEKEIKNFVTATEKIVRFISEKPRMFRSTSKKNIHEALITKHNLLIYKIYSDRIDLITFWDTRKNPRKKRFY